MYPALDDRLDTPSMHDIADRRTIHREFLRDCWKSYLAAAAPNSYSSPARAEDLSGVAPALILAAELDPLRDEAVRYAARLWQAAVSCELHVLQGAFHGVDALAPTSRVAQIAIGLVLSGLARARRSASQ
jgi:acetyl esterase/lipase